MTTTLTEDEKQVLVELTRSVAQKLRGYPSGLRLLCADEEVANYLLDKAEGWGSFFPIYLPSDLSHVVYRLKAANQNRVFSVTGDPILLLERLWHILAYHSEAEIRGCFSVRRIPGVEDESKGFIEPPAEKLNILIGKLKISRTDNLFNNLFNALAKRRNETVDLTGPFENQSVGRIRRAINSAMGNEAKKHASVLRYIGNAFLKHYKPDVQGDFTQALPPNNLHEPEAWYETDFRQSRAAKLADALEREVMRNQIHELTERLNHKRVIIVGGFGSGSDFLSRMAMRERAVAAQNGGLFRILQFAGREKTGEGLKNLLSDDLYVRGTGLVLRDLLDPATAYWPIKQDKYEIIAGFLHGERTTLLHNDFLKDFLNSVRRDAKYEDTRIIITSQYDSFEELKFAVKERKYNNLELKEERRLRAVGILNDFTADDFWNPAEQMLPSMMEDITEKIFKAWLTLEAHHMPRWLGKVHQQAPGLAQTPQLVAGQTQMQHLMRHGHIANMHRIAAWSRLWLKLLESHSHIGDFNEIDEKAKEYAVNVSEKHQELHDKNPLGIQLIDTYS